MGFGQVGLGCGGSEAQFFITWQPCAGMSVWEEGRRMWGRMGCDTRVTLEVP